MPLIVEGIWGFFQPKRSRGLKRESHQPGKDRGHSIAIAYVYILDAQGKALKTVSIGRLDTETETWATMTSGTETNVGGEIEMPPTAARAVVSVKFTCLAPNLRTKLWLDAFEFVEVE